MLGWNGPVCFHAHGGVSEEPPTTINRYAVWLDRPEILTTEAQKEEAPVNAISHLRFIRRSGQYKYCSFRHY